MRALILCVLMVSCGGMHGAGTVEVAGPVKVVEMEIGEPIGPSSVCLCLDSHPVFCLPVEPER